MKTQTALEEFTVACRNEVPLPIERIGYMLKYGKRLKKFIGHNIKLKVDLNSFESVLCSVKNRIRVKIIVRLEEDQNTIGFQMIF